MRTLQQHSCRWHSTDGRKQEVTTTSGGQTQGKTTPKTNASLQQAHPRSALRPLRDLRMRVSHKGSANASLSHSENLAFWGAQCWAQREHQNVLSLVSACSQARALSHAKASQHEVKSTALGARPQGIHEHRGASTVTVGQ